MRGKKKRYLKGRNEQLKRENNERTQATISALEARAFGTDYDHTTQQRNIDQLSIGAALKGHVNVVEVRLRDGKANA